ncbi:MAG: hypothetical protein QOI20_2926 [Acidimicrobiaceae bacterium]|nr:hypothetical protein [Acidimicrobiaceae bacterium]
MRRLRSATGLTTTGVVVLLAAFGCWFLARWVGGRTLFVLVYGVGAVVGVARFLGRRRPDLVAERSEVPTRLRQGQRMEVEVSVSAKRRVGVFLMEEQLHPHLGTTRTVPVTGLQPGTVLPHRYAVTPRLRGVYEIGPLVAVWTDPFGLTRKTSELLPPTPVIVHPATEAVHDRPLTRQWEDPPTRPPESKPWPSGFEFYGMRDYVRGDELKRVVWKAVARTGRLLIRESEQGITDRVHILIDTDTSSHSPGDPSDTFEAAIKTAASLAVHHLKTGFSVSLFGNGGRLGAVYRNEPGRIPMLDELARVERGKQRLTEGVVTLAGAAANAHTVVITPHLDGETAARLKLLIDRGTHVVLAILTWEDSDPRTQAFASTLGCQVVQLRPLASLEAVFRAEVGAGRR